MNTQTLLVFAVLLMVALEEAFGFLNLFRPRMKKRRKPFRPTKEFLRDLKALEKTIQSIGSSGTQTNSPDTCISWGFNRLSPTPCGPKHHSGRNKHVYRSYTPQYSGFPVSDHARHDFVGYNHGILHSRAPVFGPVYFHGVRSYRDALLSGSHYHWYPDHHHDDHVFGYYEPHARNPSIYPMLDRIDEDRHPEMLDQHLEPQTFSDTKLYTNELETIDENSHFEEDFPLKIDSSSHDSHRTRRRNSDTLPYFPVRLSSSLFSAHGEDRTSDMPYVHPRTRDSHDTSELVNYGLQDETDIFLSKIVTKNSKKPLNFPFYGHQMKAASSQNVIVLRNEDFLNTDQKTTQLVSSDSPSSEGGERNVSRGSLHDWEGYAWEPSEWHGFNREL